MDELRWQMQIRDKLYISRPMREYVCNVYIEGNSLSRRSQSWAPPSLYTIHARGEYRRTIGIEAHARGAPVGICMLHLAHLTARVLTFSAYIASPSRPSAPFRRASTPPLSFVFPFSLLFWVVSGASSPSTHTHTYTHLSSGAGITSAL